LLCFVGGEMALTLAGRYWRPDLSDPEYGGKLARLKERLAEGPAGRPLVLALGSSRAAMGIRPDALGTDSGPLFFNFALVGSGPVMELCCLRRLLADGIRPHAVLVECWPPFWHEEGCYAEEKRLTPYRIGWDDLQLLCAYSPESSELRRAWWQARLLPACFSRLLLLNRFAPAWVHWSNRMDDHWSGLDDWGWLRCPHSNPDAAAYHARVEQARQYYVPVFQQYHLSEVADRAMRDLLQLCRREAIAVTLYLMPEGSAFRSWYPPAVQTATDSYLQQLRREYGVGLIDGRAWAEDGELLDGFHLLPDGAARFTTRLARNAPPSVLPNPGVGE
jgi:hypothetical protein